VKVGLSESNIRCGQHHHRSTISDELVETMRTLHEEKGLGYRRIARMLGLRVYTVRDIVSYRRRNVVPSVWVEVTA
jgi:hypothetical protein